MGEPKGFETLARKRQMMRSGGNKAQDATAQPRTTARGRIAKLLDEQSFVETEAFVQHTGAAQSAPGEGVVTRRISRCWTAQ